MKAICNLEKYGTVIFEKICKNDNCKKHGVIVSFNLYNFKKNVEHAIHIHEFGDTTDGCKSLGPHYNPENTTHGSFLYPDNPRHVGDLINNFLLVLDELLAEKEKYKNISEELDQTLNELQVY